MYHYLYRITNQITGEYYYGVHSTERLDDGYFGSGSDLHKNIQKYGKENFYKENLEFFNSRTELMKAERNIVDENLLKDPLCLNIILGGGELKGSVGKKCVILDDGSMAMVDKHNYDHQNFMVGRIAICKNGSTKYIKPYQFDHYLKQGWTKGTTAISPSKNKIWVFKEGKRKQILESDLQQHIDNGWQRGFAIQRTVWVYKNDTSKQVPATDLQHYIDEGWTPGFHKPTVNGRVCIVKDNTIKYVEDNDLQKYYNEGWVRRTWSDTVWVHKESENKRIYKDELEHYSHLGWIPGRYNGNNSRRRAVYLCKLDGSPIKKYNSIQQAIDDGYNNISKYCRTGKVFQNKYVWKYAD